MVSLRREWRLFDQDGSNASDFLELCERMLDVGEFLLAHDVARAGLKNNKGHKLLSQRSAFALAKAGSPGLAVPTLEELVASGIRDTETLSLLASTYKDLCETAVDPEKKQEYADLAIARYEQSYFSEDAPDHGQSSADNLYYPCINVAFMHFVCMNYTKLGNMLQKLGIFASKSKKREKLAIGTGNHCGSPSLPWFDQGGCRSL